MRIRGIDLIYVVAQKAIDKVLQEPLIKMSHQRIEGVFPGDRKLTWSPETKAKDKQALISSSGGGKPAGDREEGGWGDAQAREKPPRGCLHLKRRK